MRVCQSMTVITLLIWGFWAGTSRHPSLWKLWAIVIIGGLATLVEIYDFPPYWRFFDAIMLFGTPPQSLSLSFGGVLSETDAEFRTSTLIKKVK